MLDKSNKKLLHEKGAAVNNKALFISLHVNLPILYKLKSKVIF